MTTVKQLPKGIPQGYKPQKQDVHSNAHVMVSEHTRRIAHELDDLHSAWIMRHKNDDLATIRLSPFANGNVPVRHLDWLMEYDAAEDRYQKVLERRQWIQDELGNMKRSRKVDGKFHHKEQFLTHYETLKLELLYCSVLQSKLKSVTTAVKHVTHHEKMKYIGDLLKEMNCDNHALVSLVELRASLVEWLKASPEVQISDRLQFALDGSHAVIRAETTEIFGGAASLANEGFVILDGFMARRSEFAERKPKGNAINTPTWLPIEGADQ